MKTGAAARLATLVKNCLASGTQRHALMLRIDRFPTALSRPHHIRLAEAALKPMLREPRAELFELAGPRLVVVWRGDAEESLLEVVESLDRLLEDSSVCAPPLPQVLVLYDLPEHANLLLDAVETQGEGEAAESPAPSTPLDPALLTLLEASLAQADVSRFARRQSVWRMDRAAASLAWEARTLSAGELAEGLVPGHDLMAEPWLFRRLTRTLDRRMLALLSSPGELADARPFAVELNVASVLGPEFLRFDANLPATLRGRVAIALPPADLVADARSYSFAAGFAHARSYRLMLQDATPTLLQVLAPVLPELDFALVPWSASLASEPAALLQTCSPDRVVLTRCPNLAAIAWGQDWGIAHFAGPGADRAALGEKAAAA